MLLIKNYTMVFLSCRFYLVRSEICFSSDEIVFFNSNFMVKIRLVYYGSVVISCFGLTDVLIEWSYKDRDICYS